MTQLIVITLVLIVVAAVSILVTRRRGHVDDGVTTFRRHIDALSPEARREVIDRVKNARETGRGK